MNAREELIAMFAPFLSGKLLEEAVAYAYAVVMREAAHFVGNDDTCDCGGCDTCVPRQLAAGLRRMAGEKATATAATATPDFFQPGHTYTREHHGHRIEFLVEHVATPPGGSHPVAFGWKTAFGWPEEPFDSDDLDGWTDTADTTQGDSQ